MAPTTLHSRSPQSSLHGESCTFHSIESYSNPSLCSIVEITVGLMVPCAASFAKIYRKHKSTVTPTFISTLRSRRERKEPVILGRDEMVLYSTQVSSGWKDLSSVSSYQPKSTDLPCVETAH
jgi:hypothetical protein